MSDSLFPLYETLLRQQPQMIKEYTLEEKDTIATRIKNLKQEEHKPLFIIIRIYQLKNLGINFEIPYSGVYKQGNIKFDLNLFPDKLISLIETFLNIAENRDK